MPIDLSQPLTHMHQRLLPHRASTASHDVALRIDGDYARLITELHHESDRLLNALGRLSSTQWQLSIGIGRSIKDQICHVAYHDDAALLALTRPDEFRIERDQYDLASRDCADPIALQYRAARADTLVAWCTDSRHQLVLSLIGDDPHRTLGWFHTETTVETLTRQRLVESRMYRRDVERAVAGTSLSRP